MNMKWKQIRDAYGRFVDGKGFALIVTLCAAVITGTAIWTGSSSQAYLSPTPPVTEEQSAALLMQQSIENVSTPSPLPHEDAPEWQSPLPELIVLRGYSPDVMLHSGVTGIWAIHAGTDLKAASGDTVWAIADGMVAACGEDKMKGHYVEIRHSHGYVSSYLGLQMLGAIRVGDRIRAGQTIGFVGNTLLDETDLGPHVHLELRKNGATVDPLNFIR